MLRSVLPVRQKHTAARLQRKRKAERLETRIQFGYGKNVRFIDDVDFIAAILRIVPADKFVPVQCNGQQRHAFAVNDGVRIGFLALVPALVDVADHICFRFENRIQIQCVVHSVKVLDVFSASVFLGIPAEEGISRFGSSVQFMYFPRPDGYGIFCLRFSFVQVVVYRKQIVAFLPERIQRHILCRISADALVLFAAVRLIVPPQKHIPFADGIPQRIQTVGRYTFGVFFSVQNAAVQFIADGIHGVAPLCKQFYAFAFTSDLRDRLSGIISRRIPAFKHRAVLFGQKNFQQTAFHRKSALRRL